jgi:hypothetical protein
MKPNYALGLTDDGVTLWLRGKDGWLRVGAVALDSDDMDSAMAALVARAREVGPKELTTKLVIPSEHLLLTHISAPGPGPDAQSTQIRAALTGRTPFPVTELVFDWSGAGTTVAVAVVARETLIEAEDFAQSNGLEPLCFVASRAPDGFRGEPFLGLTRSARAKGLDPAGLRDPSVLRQTGIALPPPPPPQPVTPVAAKPALPPVAPTAPVAQPASAPEKAVAPPTEKTPADKPSSDATGEVQSDIKPDAPKTPDTSDMAFRSRRNLTAPLAHPLGNLPPKPEATAKPEGKKVKPNFGNLVQGKLDSLRASLPALRAPALPKVALRKPAMPDEAAAKAALSIAAPATSANKTATPKPATDPLAQLRKLQSRTKAPVQAPPRPVVSAKAVLAPQPSATAPSEAERLTVFGARGAANAAAAAAPLPQRALLLVGGGVLVLVCAAIWALYFARGAETIAPVLDSSVISPPAAVASLPAPEDDLPEDDALAAIEAALASEDAAQSDRPAEDGSDQSLISNPAPQDQAQDQAQEQAQPAPAAVPEAQMQLDTATGQDVLPRVEEGLGGRLAEVRSNSVIAPQDQSALPTSPFAPAPFGAEPLPPLRNAAAAPADAPTDQAEVTTETPAADPEAALEISVQQGRPPSRPPAKPARFLQPEAPAATQDAPQQQGAIFPATDAPVQVADSDQADPPLGADGLAQTRPSDAAGPAPLDTAQTLPAPPVSEAALRIAVTTGLPPSVPPQRDARPAPELAAAPLAVPVQPDATSQANVTLAALPVAEQDLQIAVTRSAPPILPPQREATAPADLPDPMATELAATALDAPDLDATRASVTPGALALTALRPLPRPSDLRAPQAPADLVPEFANASALAVANSLRPRARPSGFGDIVQRSLRAATRQQAVAATPPPPEAVQTVSAAVAATPMPNLPTATSVAREATQARAINLRQVNLIGVMGTTSNRRALVRLSNGRVVTVRVGETLDDGQVTAISDSELRYNKRGRDVVLRIAS